MECKSELRDVNVRDDAKDGEVDDSLGLVLNVRSFRNKKRKFPHFFPIQMLKRRSEKRNERIGKSNERENHNQYRSSSKIVWVEVNCAPRKIITEMRRGQNFPSK